MLKLALPVVEPNNRTAGVVPVFTRVTLVSVTLPSARISTARSLVVIVPPVMAKLPPPCACTPWRPVMVVLLPVSVMSPPVSTYAP